MRNNISRYTVLLVLLVGLVLTYSDFAKKAIAETENPPIELYKSKKYSELIDRLSTKSVQDLNSADHYLLLKSFNQTGNYLQSRQQLDLLEQKLPQEFSAIILYEKLNLFQITGEKEEILKVIATLDGHGDNFYLLNFVCEIFIREYQDFSNKLLLRQSLEVLIPFAQDLDNGPDILRIYAGTFANNDPRVKEIAVDIWVLEDQERLSDSEKTIVNWIKARVPSYTEDIVNHYQHQRRFRNYTYMADTIPGFLKLIEDKENGQYKELRNLFFYAMAKKKRFNQLIEMLAQKDMRNQWGLTDYEALSIQFDLLVRKGDPKSSITVLNRLIKMQPEEDVDLKYLALAEYYFQRNHFKQALVFYHRLHPYQSNVYDISNIKWKLWRTYFLMGNQEELNKIADWAKHHEFENDEMGARFCYWGYKLNFYSENSAIQCYQQYPLTYYGLHSRYTSNQSKDLTNIKIPVNLISTSIADIQPELKEQLSFLKLLYQVGENDLADAVVRTRLLSSDSKLMLAFANLLLEEERYFMVQFIVESKLRPLLENSKSSRKVLLPYFYPLAFDEQVSLLEDKQHVPKTLILSVMREESHFNPLVKSGAGAIGLMQLMPDTAQYIGRKIGLKVDLDALSEPEINLKLGSAYLKRLMKRYNGNVFYALAAYNGGPTNVNRWLAKTGTDDVDEFVESITFEETQNYVRRVMRSYYIYRTMYDQL